MRLLLTVSLLLIALMLVAGCSDDKDCATCPEDNQRGTMYGEMNLHEGYLEMWATITGVSGPWPDVDSVLVDGHVAALYPGLSTEQPGIGVSFYESEEKSAGLYESGDTILIEIFTPYGVSVCREKALDSFTDAPEIINFSLVYPYDTVEVGEDLTITWHKIVHADWYGFEIDYGYVEDGESLVRELVYYTADTSLTIPASELDVDGRLYIAIYPTTGPYPDDRLGNIEGDVIRGVISSDSYDSFRIYIGTGEYATAPANHEPDTPTRSFREAYQSITGRQAVVSD